ncbi:MAG: hypothetical protein HY652_03920 [Acidobacteria bacterium]|nr:hypothetical protein [Acidobacteriota bacterium]
MQTGFNSDVAFGDATFHVQTEDQGGKEPSIVTLVYRSGKILYSRRTPYPTPLAGERLRELMHQQHRDVVEGVRRGEIEPLRPRVAPQGPAWEVRVEPAGPSFTPGSLSLQIQVQSKNASRPVVDGKVWIKIVGPCIPPRIYSGRTDPHGCCTVELLIPPLRSHGELELVVEHPEGRFEKHFPLQPAG